MEASSDNTRDRPSQPRDECDNNNQNQVEENDFSWKKALLIAFVVFISVSITCLCIVGVRATTDYYLELIDLELPKEQAVWFEKGYIELENALSATRNPAGRAKNVVLFIGDGMGTNTVTASRIAKYGEEGLLSWEKFPEMGMLKTYCADKQVPDSMSTATALFSGIKVNYETGGVDSSVKYGNCEKSLDEKHHIHSIIKLAQDQGLKTGFVTTTRVTHATPAALYAHVPSRRWECENKVPNEAKKAGCKDIARILIEDEPGRSINVIMGGGRQCLRSDVPGNTDDPIDTWACKSTDGRDLILNWEQDKSQRGLKYAIVNNTKDFNSINSNEVDYLLGIFANGHMKYDHERNKGSNGTPSIGQMTKKAIEILTNDNKRGFVLVVEAGNIDQAHHRGAARKAISETLALDKAVEVAMDTLGDALEETLVIVTSDHSHTLTINGYPDRGNSIFGIASKSKIDDKAYTTLTYGTSYYGYQVEVNKQTMEGGRHDPINDDTTSYDYIQQSAIKTDENTHGGSDVAVYATGPLSHLFHRIHEQSYVAHVIQFALRLGRFSDVDWFDWTWL